MDRPSNNPNRAPITIFEFVTLCFGDDLGVTCIMELCATFKIRVQGREVREEVRARIAVITALSRYQGARTRGVRLGCFALEMLSK